MPAPAGIPRRRGSRASQRGLGLLVILVVAGVLAVVLVGNSIFDRQAEQIREQTTQAALNRAKSALIAYASSQMYDAYGGVPDTPGHLPCPAVTPATNPLNLPEGSTAGECGDTNDTVVGRLPWRSLGTSALRDGTGECLWYAVSGRFKNNPRGLEIFNWDTEGQIRVINADGSLLADKVAAVIIAPGIPIGQTRTLAAATDTCPGSHDPAAYLEADRGASNHTMVDSNPANEPAVSTLIQGGIDPATKTVKVNDRMAIITARELAEAIERRKDFGARALHADPGWDQGQLRKLMVVMANCLASSPDYRLPWAGSRVQVFPINLGGTTSALQEVRSENGLLAGRAPSLSAAGVQYVVPVVGHCDPSSMETKRAVSWWNQWRDHLYFAISPDFSPSAPTPVNPCGSLPNRCLSVNTSAPRYAGVLIFAGRRLAGQNRPQWSTSTTNPLEERRTYANYLEGVNLTNIAAAPTWAAAPVAGSPAYQYRSDPIPSATADDFAYCIEITPPTVTVAPCPTS